jgi:copper resistance protein B
VTRIALLAFAVLVAGPAAAQPASSAPPPWTGDYAADRDYDPAAMAHARMMAREEMGGMRFSKVALKLGEYQSGSDGGGYRWDAEAWFGGDINRLAIRTEGEGKAKGGLEAAEAQLLYSRAISPYFDVQAGVRQDVSPRGRTYLTLGTQGLAPYWADLEGAVFVSTNGQVLARGEATYDLRLFQRVVLQPRLEVNLAAEDDAKARIGSGLSNAELGLRLRYEIRREFAPYVGVSWERRFGRTASFARAAGESADGTAFVVGLSGWF